MARQATNPPHPPTGMRGIQDMKHSLRPYQRTTCLSVITHRADNPLLVAPTGAGKTTCGVYIAQALRHLGVVWVAHRVELIDQAVERFAAHGITTGIIKADRTPSEADIHVASVQTLARRATRNEKVFIIDEAHRAAADSYRRCIPADAIVIGLTATPFRHDGKGLGDLFGRIFTAATTAELVEDGTLHDPEVWVVRPPDMSAVRQRAGEYATAETTTATNTPERRADIVDQWKQRADGMRTLAFACSIDHSREIVAAFTAAGVPAEHVDGDTPDEDRQAAIARLAAGDTLVLCNVALFTEGFDLPAIECIIDAAPTASLGRHLQKIGRVMRTSPGKSRAVVHDHAGNHLRLGRVTQPLAYTLDSGVQTHLSEPLGLSHCGECFRLYAGDTCPSCGAERPASERETLGIDGRAGMVEMSEQDVREAYFDRLCEEQVQYDRKDGWVLHQFKDKYGEWPTVCRLEENGPLLYVNPDRADMTVKRAFFKGMLTLAVDKGFKPGWASVRYRDVFGVWPKGFVDEVKEECGLNEDNEALEALWA